tara:strand:+ start:44 stop:379 length:336 start_codon:yes stop_codon:yes gene_type:complete
MKKCKRYRNAPLQGLMRKKPGPTDIKLPTIDDINQSTSDSTVRGQTNVNPVTIIPNKTNLQKEYEAKAKASRIAAENQKKSIVYDKNKKNLEKIMQSNSLARLFTGIRPKG